MTTIKTIRVYKYIYVFLGVIMSALTIYYFNDDYKFVLGIIGMIFISLMLQSYDILIMINNIENRLEGKWAS